MTLAAKAALAATIMLAGCQSYVDAQGRTHLSTGPLIGQAAQAPTDAGHAYSPRR